MVKRVVASALVLGLLPAVASAQSLRASITPAAFQQSATDWQRQYDEAVAHKARAKRNMFIGLGTSIVGFVLAATASSDCTDAILSGGDCSTGNGRLTLGWITNLAGGGVFIWGLVDYFDANGDMNRLAVQKPSKNALLVPIGEHQSIGVSIGKTSNLSYRVKW